MKPLEDLLSIGTQAVQQAGKFLLQNFGSTKKTQHKSGTHYGIAEDIQSDQIIRDFLKKYSPTVSIFSEEGGHFNPELGWVVDALDGTSNYRVGIPMFVVQLALVKNEMTVVSVVFAPALDLLFTATKGRGATLNRQPIQVSGVTAINESMVSLNKGTQRKDLRWYASTVTKVMRYVRTTRHFGSAGLMLAYVASGKLDGYLDSGSQLYDVAPGTLLVREAGGIVMNFKGNEWSVDDRTVVASNPHLVHRLVNMTQA